MAEIWATLATKASEHVATRFVMAIEAHFEPLRHFPFSGPSREHLAPGLRVTFHGAYAIYYLPRPYLTRPEALVIVRVIHGARDMAGLAERGGFV